MSKLIFRYGAMNSGKSIQVQTVAHNYEERNMKVIIAKPGKDTKAGDKVSSRIGLERKVDLIIKENDSLLELYKNGKIDFKDINCIIVDEAQFLQPSQVNELRAISEIADIPVICYGLRTDFQTNSFPGSKRLFELADIIEEIPTICSCSKKAKFNARTLNGKFVYEGEQVVIDGETDYEYTSLCPKCYLKKVLKAKLTKGNFFKRVIKDEDIAKILKLGIKE